MAIYWGAEATSSFPGTSVVAGRGWGGFQEDKPQLFLGERTCWFLGSSLT